MDRESLQERFGITGTSAAIRHVIDQVRLVSKTDVSVLIQGESGVGKELVALAIHQLSGRRHKPLITVNCGAIPEGLLESELFGTEKGAYTGAVERRNGYFEEADKGTVFLDEIGEMAAAAQVRLLRVLESGEFSRVGSAVSRKADVRVIAATNKSLSRAVHGGGFREDLYYRLATVVIDIPPLRDRREDIMPIFDQFLHQSSQQYSTAAKRLDEAARELLLRYRWPGNVRELRNVADRLTVMFRGDTVKVDDLRPLLRGVSAGGQSGGLVPVKHDGKEAGDARERELVYRALVELRLEIRELKDQIKRLVAGAHLALPPSIRDRRASDYHVDENTSDDNFSSYIEDVPYEIEAESATTGEVQSNPETDDILIIPDQRPIPTLGAAERHLIDEALKRFGGNRRQASRALGISERTLYRKIKEYENGEDEDQR